MADRTVLSLLSSNVQLERAVQSLERHGFEAPDINVLALRARLPITHAYYPREAQYLGLTFSVFDTAEGNSVVASGPLRELLQKERGDARPGSIARALAGLGIHYDEATRCEEKVTDGSVAVLVRSSAAHADEARTLLESEEHRSGLWGAEPEDQFDKREALRQRE